MRSNLRTISLVIAFAILLFFVGCSKDRDRSASVTFGANYHVINCITTVTVYLDGKKIGRLENYTDTLRSCEEPGNLTKDIVPGKHSYKVEVRPLEGNGCMKDIKGTFKVKDGECYKVFIDYFTLWEE